MPETISKLLATIQESAKAVLATTKTHRWWWAGGGGAALVAIIALVVVFGGFLGPSGKAICTVALDRARDYGVIPYGAALAGTEAKSTDVKDRRVCAAQVGDDVYNLSVDLKCKDMKKDDCVVLYSVARSDGMTTFQVREIPPEDAETAALPPPVDTPAGATDAAPAAGASDTGADTAVDNSTAPAGGLSPDTAPPVQPAQQQPAQDSGMGQPNPQ